MNTFRKSGLLLVCAIASISVILLLQRLSLDVNRFSSHFVRIFPSHAIDHPRVLPLPSRNFYLAGLYAHHVYLGNYYRPLQYLSVSCDVQDSASSIFQLAQKPTFFGVPQLRIDSGMHWLIEPNVPYVLIDDKYPDSTYSFPLLPALRPLGLWVPLSATSAIARVYDSATRQNVLVKVTRDAADLKYNKTILTKQVDGFFCTDGMLHWQKDKGKLVYVYYYRHQLLSLDTNLRVIETGHTIDTFSHAQIAVSTTVLPGHTQRTMARPPIYVNLRSYIAGGTLYIQSGLRADNEKLSTFQRSAVIDVYTVDHLRYKYSFYIPHYNGMPLTDFAIDQHDVVALYQDQLVIYELNF